MSFLGKLMDKRIAAYQRELIETHYREVENMYRQIRGWRHDYRNHIQVMKAYAAEDNLEAIRRYLDALDQDLTTVDTTIKTGIQRLIRLPRERSPPARPVKLPPNPA